MALGSVVFAFGAGVLSSLSPCVLPILPIVFGAAMARHRWGPAVLAAGVALSFTGIGLFVATIGFSLGLDAGFFRPIAAVILIGFGLVMLLPRLQDRYALTAGRFSAWIGPVTNRFAVEGLRGQFLLGLTLGIVWSPCVGPTLGAASVLAAQGRELAQVALTMLAFGVGASLPLIGLGVVSRHFASRWRGSLLVMGQQGKAALGTIAGLAGLLIITGLDRPFEALLVNASPEWLVQLTTRF
ncbi:MAG TPA: cytochrome c biogenesis CcdA family protein [Candidatus Binataceae bacterium]|nr:cytochrome c biogenesis CcdA family protein [Candidatus Binataceae bacterium]